MPVISQSQASNLKLFRPCYLLLFTEWEDLKEPLENQAALMYNLLRKVNRTRSSDIPSVKSKNYKNLSILTFGRVGMLISFY